MDGLRPSVRPQPPSRRALPWLLRRPEALRLHHRATPSRRPRRAIPAANAEVLVPAAAEAAVGEGLPLRAAAARGDPRRLLPLRRRLPTQLLLDARTKALDRRTKTKFPARKTA